MTFFDSQRFAAQIKVKRGDRSLRQTTKDIGETGGDISASTLLRLEQGKTPDMKAFIAICDWLNIEPDEFMLTPQRPKVQRDPMERIEVILRYETMIAPVEIEAIMIVLRALYEYAEKDREVTQ